VRRAFFLCLAEADFGSCEEGIQGRVCGVKGQAFLVRITASSRAVVRRERMLRGNVARHYFG